MDLKALQWELAAFVADRGWEPLHNPKNLAMALATEAASLLELFKWLTGEQSRHGSADQKAIAAEAIADIMLHALRLADELGIDLEEAVQRKFAKDREKHPVRPAVRDDEELARSEPSAPEETSIAKERTPTPAPVAERPRPTAEVEPPVRRPVRASLAPPPAAPRSAPPAPPTASRPQRVSTTRSAQPAAAAPPARAASVPPAPAPAPERYANLDANAAKEFLKSLSHRLDSASRVDPLLRELRDELETLKRTLHSAAPKPVWIAESLKTVRTMLASATAEHSIADAIKARDHLALVDRILKE